MSEMDTVSMKDVTELTVQLVRLLGKAQNDWVSKRDLSKGMFLERAALWCAYTALSSAFAMDKVTDDPEALAVLREFVKLLSGSITTGPASEAIAAPTVMA